jgi:hypothetical protein
MPLEMRWPLLALGATLLLAGCGGNEDPGQTPAGQAQVRFLYNLYHGRLDAAYSSLHPAYQRLVPRKRFVVCTRKTALGDLDSIEILKVDDDPVEIPGAGRVPAKAVHVRLTSSNGGATSFVNHEVEVGSAWRWVLNAAAAKAYRAGRCPGG